MDYFHKALAKGKYEETDTGLLSPIINCHPMRKKSFQFKNKKYELEVFTQW